MFKITANRSRTRRKTATASPSWLRWLLVGLNWLSVAFGGFDFLHEVIAEAGFMPILWVRMCEKIAGAPGKNQGTNPNSRATSLLVVD